MGDGHHDSFKTIQVVLQDRQRGDVQIVGGLVQQQKIGGGRQHAQKVQALFLPAGKLSDGAVLLIRRKKESFQHGRRGQYAVRRLYIFCGVLHIIDNPLLRIHIRKIGHRSRRIRTLPSESIHALPSGNVRLLLPGSDLLGIISHFYSLADHHLAGIRRKETGDDLHQRGFSTAVGADKSHPVPLQENIAEIVDQLLFSVAFADRDKLHRGSPHSRRNGTKLHTGIPYGGLPVPQLLKPLNMRLLLSGTGPGSPADPFQLHAQDGLALALAGVLHFLPLRLQLQETGIVGLIAVDCALVDLRNPAGHAVQKIPVMRYHDQSSLPFFQIILQPVGHLIVQMVGGLVQQQNVRRGQERRDQRQPFSLTSGKLARRLGKIPDPQPGHHRLRVALNSPPVLLRHIARQHAVQAGHLRGKFRMLGEVADHRMIGRRNGSLIRLLQPGHHS